MARERTCTFVVEGEIAHDRKIIPMLSGERCRVVAVGGALRYGLATVEWRDGNRPIARHVAHRESGDLHLDPPVLVEAGATIRPVVLTAMIDSEGFYGTVVLERR